MNTFRCRPSCGASSSATYWRIRPRASSARTRARQGEGFASLHLQHVGSDRRLWTGGNPLTLVERLQNAAQESEAIARVHDLRFALDQALGGEFGELLDDQFVAAAGHSYGANTTLLASGAQVVRDGRMLDLREPRLRAAIIISAPPFHGEPALLPILGPVRLPGLHVAAAEDVIRIPGFYSGADDRVAVFEAMGSTRKTLAMFSGGSHSMFTDRVGTGGLLPSSAASCCGSARPPSSSTHHR